MIVQINKSIYFVNSPIIIDPEYLYGNEYLKKSENSTFGLYWVTFHRTIQPFCIVKTICKYSQLNVSHTLKYIYQMFKKIIDDIKHLLVGMCTEK